MRDQSFSAPNLLRLMSKADPRKHGLGRNRKQYKENLIKISDEINHENYSFIDQNFKVVSGEKIFKTTSRTDVFSNRKLRDNLSRIYSVKQASRSLITEQIAALLREEAPYFVVKLDIKKFYNNTNYTKVKNIINDDPRPSFQTKRIFDLLLKTSAFKKQNGLPRGLGISSTISEINMREFDKTVSSISGVYYYARYVDDIILFTVGEPLSLISEVSKSLPHGLELNTEKQKILKFNKKECLEKPQSSFLEHLGYRFDFNNNGLKKPRVTIGIAEKKIKKLKSKIMLSLFYLLHEKDLLLCRDRLRFLTANIAMKSKVGKGVLFSGLYYNYPLIESISKRQLVDLDSFMRKAVFSRNGEFGKKLSLIVSSEDRILLAKNSFLVGFERRIKYTFNSERLSQIVKCWKK